MKTKAALVVLMTFLFVVSYFVFYSAYDFYQSDEKQWTRGLTTIDSLQRVGKWKEVKVEKLLWVDDSTTINNNRFGTRVIPAAYFIGCDTVFIMNAITLDEMNLPDRLSSNRIKYIYHPKNKRFEIIEWWTDGKLFYDVAKYLHLEKANSGIIVFLTVFGTLMASMATLLFVVLYRFITGWIKMRDDVKLHYLEKKKMSPAQLSVLEYYFTSWNDQFVIYVIIGALMVLAAFILPVKFFGLREMLRSAFDDGGNETLASMVGFLPVAIGALIVISLFTAEYIIIRMAMLRDSEEQQYVMMKGKIKGVYRDKKDNDQLKAVVKIGRMEFDDQEIAERSNLKKGDEVNVYLTFHALQIVGITRADSSR